MVRSHANRGKEKKRKEKKREREKKAEGWLNGRPISKTIFIQFSNKQKHTSRVKNKQNVKN